jgi:hypothetical protein
LQINSASSPTAKSCQITFRAQPGVARFIAVISPFFNQELAQSPIHNSHQNNALQLQCAHLAKMQWLPARLQHGYMEFRFRSLSPSMFSALHVQFIASLLAPLYIDQLTLVTFHPSARKEYLPLHHFVRC